jgi:plastocyanin
MSTRRCLAALVISNVLIGCGSAGPDASPVSLSTPTGAGRVATVPATSAPTVAPTTPPPPQAASVVEVRMVGNQFQPRALEVRPGTTVRWSNADPDEHDVIAQDGSFESPPFGTGGTYERTFAAAGSFPYYCDLHSDMEGTITVR